MKKLLLFCIRTYQAYLSPLKPRGCCRFAPVCSEYARVAIDRFGAFKGGYLAICRLWRCNPLFPGGYDPVPTVFAWRRRNRHYQGYDPADPECDQACDTDLEA